MIYHDISKQGLFHLGEKSWGGGGQIMMFRVNLINYLVKLLSNVFMNVAFRSEKYYVF